MEQIQMLSMTYYKNNECLLWDRWKYHGTDWVISQYVYIYSFFKSDYHKFLDIPTNYYNGYGNCKHDIYIYIYMCVCVHHGHPTIIPWYNISILIQ